MFSRSNWTPPQNLRTPTTSPSSNINNPCKYIIRLNINCVNYDSMLYFYRLLFSKCSNYSKQHFSLFVLKTTRLEDHQQPNSSLNIEYQLSLKYDPTVIVETSKNSSLILQINDRQAFENIINVLAMYVIELVKYKIYSIQDPDKNKIILVDTSVRFIIPIAFIANSVGLSENFFQLKKSRQLGLLSSSCSSNSSFNCSTNSPGSLHSVDSANMPCKNVAKLIKSKKKLKNNSQKSNNQKQNEEDHVAVKDLIKKFSESSLEINRSNNEAMREFDRIRQSSFQHNQQGYKSR